MKALKIIIFITLTTLLVGCYSNVVYQTDSEIQKPQAQIKLLNEQLAAYDVRIIQNSDSMVLVLPNKTLFNSKSANFTKAAYKILDLIFDLTSYYEKSVISVMGFTKANSVDALDTAVAIERAHKVVQYLWRSGIDASFMYADGTNVPIIKNNKLFFTSCVVINFRKLNVY
jgi:outer membrane protein OmpA-like peptidoglycan-associated protein